MSLSAQQIFDAVQGVPEEALANLDYHDEGEPHFRDHDQPVTTQTAELALVGSMLCYLIGEGCHSFEWGCGETDVRGPSLEIMGIDDPIVAPLDLPPGSDTLWLLAQACRAVGGRQQG